jgi:hypothetical protein
MEYKGIEESLKYLVEAISELREDIIDIKSELQLKTYSLKDIAVLLGYKSDQSLLNHPWKMPNFGRPDVGHHPRRWFYSTIIKWYAVPEDERRFRWESMTGRERRETLGIIKTAKEALPGQTNDFNIVSDRSKAG